MIDLFYFIWNIDNINDVYWLAEAYYQAQHYEQALDLLNTKETISKSVQCRYLAGLCAVKYTYMNINTLYSLILILFLLSSLLKLIFYFIFISYVYYRWH